MAAAPMPMTPPPSPGGGQPAPIGPGPDVVSPAPPTQPNPAMADALKKSTELARDLIAISKAFPSTVSIIAQIKPLISQMTAAMLEDAQPPEPTAPPQG